MNHTPPQTRRLRSGLYRTLDNRFEIERIEGGEWTVHLLEFTEEDGLRLIWCQTYSTKADALIGVSA
jgi:hypothetical protein